MIPYFLSWKWKEIWSKDFVNSEQSDQDDNNEQQKEEEDRQKMIRIDQSGLILILFDFIISSRRPLSPK